MSERAEELLDELREEWQLSNMIRELIANGYWSL